MNKAGSRHFVDVDLGDRSYQIIIGEEIISEAEKLIAPLRLGKKKIIVTDQNVARNHLISLRKALENGGHDPVDVILKPGEQTKSFSGLRELLESILKLGVDRDTCLIALGGGVIGDIAGFAASTILRGIHLIQIPTSLLAMVDSSVGGKTAINTPQGKNLVGTFYQPRLVISDTASLRTLPNRELLSGYAEIVKYGLLGDALFFEWLEENGDKVIDCNPVAIAHAVATSCRSKALIVTKDEREGGVRALLNLGHTFGHALETETGFSETLLHGEAVSIGITMAFDLSVRMGLCPGIEARRAISHLKKIGLPVALKSIEGIDWSSDRLISHMARDKKVRNGNINFVLTKGIGKAFVCEDVHMADVKAIIDKNLNS